MRNSKGQFIKGHSPKNSIQKGEHRSISTEFKKGHIPDNKLSIGSVTIRKHRHDSERAWIKIAEPNKWILRAEYIWEICVGSVPEGFVIHHIDGNTLNDEITNLSCQIRGAHINQHRDKLQKAKCSFVKIREIECSKCGVIFAGKYQRKDSICDDCRRISRYESQRRYKQRIHSRNR